MGDGDFGFYILIWAVGVLVFGVCARMLAARHHRHHWH
jgi:hypothetical protein